MLLNGANQQAVERAADLLAACELLAFPTETVYGLGARADDDAAVAKVFAAKGRPIEHPLIVHVGNAAQALHFASEWPPLAERLAAAFWPGPLTLIVPRAPGVASAAAGGQTTIGLRCPAHPLAQALLAAAAARGVHGVAAPSANRFGRISPTTAAHVQSEFGDALAVLDGGPCEVGIESAIVDCSRGRPVLLRPGSLSRERLEAAAGQALTDRDADAPRASGTLEAHYAPRAKLRLMPAAALGDALRLWADARNASVPADARNASVPADAGSAAPRSAAAASLPPRLAVYSRTVRAPQAPGLVARKMPDTARAAAYELFAVLRELDALGVALIWVEQPPGAADWDGVRDRLHRAAAA